MFHRAEIWVGFDFTPILFECLTGQRLRLLLLLLLTSHMAENPHVYSRQHPKCQNLRHGDTRSWRADHKWTPHHVQISNWLWFSALFFDSVHMCNKHPGSVKHTALMCTYCQLPQPWSDRQLPNSDDNNNSNSYACTVCLQQILYSHREVF